MAHFVSLIRGVPDPDVDDLEEIYLSSNGSGRVGLWGFLDISTNTVCSVKVSDGSGKVKSAEKKGTRVLVFDLTGVNDGASIQAFSGNRPFSQPIKVIRRNSDDIGVDNKSILLGGGSENVCQIAGKPVSVIPLTKGFGNYKHFPQISSIHGLAVHITAGGHESLEGLKQGFESGKSTHFAIDRAGKIAQYIAACYQSQAHEDGNPNWLSVELVGKASTTGDKCQSMSSEQLETLKKLYTWVFMTFPLPTWNLAAPFQGEKKIGALSEHYKNMAKEFERLGYSKPAANTINECIASTGLSCQYWVSSHPKACPGAAIMSQMPQVFGFDQVRVAGDEKFML